jgi:DNA adenine methylase
VSLEFTPKKAVINDINPHVINFYKWLKKGLIIDIPMEINEKLYYKHRDRFNSLIKNNKINTKEAASLFYYLNRTGFNGLCRFNKSGFFNVPFGSHKTINYIRDFRSYKANLKEWDFFSSDFEDIKFKSNDFIYADPPYDVPFTQYSSGGFTWEDQVRTAELFAKHRGPVVLSNQATDRILSLYRSLGYKIKILEAPRLINCTGNRDKVKEVLATRNI